MGCQRFCVKITPNGLAVTSPAAISLQYCTSLYDNYVIEEGGQDPVKLRNQIKRG